MKTARRLLDDCFRPGKETLRHAEALKLIDERLIAVARTEIVPLAQAYGRVLAEDVFAARPVPGFSNAAVDGYAFAYGSLFRNHNRLKVAERIAAGDEALKPLEKGEAARVFTGAAIPANADTCVMQEDVTVEDDHIVVPSGLKPGANLRKAGEDVRSGGKLADAGQRLRPQELAAIAAAGRTELRCFRPLTIGLLSTGNEVVRPGEPLGVTQVFDSNHFMLNGMLAAMGFGAADLGIIPDDPAMVRTALEAAAEVCDVVISTGGASRGETDHVMEALGALGSVHAWGLAVKPGRRLAMGQVGDTVFCGLPGNPVAAFVSFGLYARLILARLQGAFWHEPRRYLVPAGFAVAERKPGRREYWRGWIGYGGDGRPVLQKFAYDGSALISGLRQAEGLIEVPEEMTAIAEGEPLAFIPFTELGLPPK
ncbi:MAG: gephyrin-like molybdotransferase Glp [Parvibaculaceae bacterium]